MYGSTLEEQGWLSCLMDIGSQFGVMIAAAGFKRLAVTGFSLLWLLVSWQHLLELSQRLLSASKQKLLYLLSLLALERGMSSLWSVSSPRSRETPMKLVLPLALWDSSDPLEAG
jgi:hypothetical protein